MADSSTTPTPPPPPPENGGSANSSTKKTSTSKGLMNVKNESGPNAKDSGPRSQNNNPRGERSSTSRNSNQTKSDSRGIPGESISLEQLEFNMKHSIGISVGSESEKKPAAAKKPKEPKAPRPPTSTSQVADSYGEKVPSGIIFNPRADNMKKNEGGKERNEQNKQNKQKINKNNVRGQPSSQGSVDTPKASSPTPALNPTAVEFKPNFNSNSLMKALNISDQPPAAPVQEQQQVQYYDHEVYCMESSGSNNNSSIGNTKPSAKKNNKNKNKNNSTATGIITGTEIVESAPEFQEESLACCTICATEPVEYFAVGECNHHICSLCAIRIRVKTKDYCCALCKSVMNILVVYPVTPGKELLEYNSFNVSAEDFDTVSPNLNTDAQHNIIYVNCNEHYRYIETIRSISCPCIVSDKRNPTNQSVCGERFSNNTQLLSHMNNKHNQLTICKLCLEHRPLFITEHVILTPAALKLHNKFGDTTNFTKDTSMNTIAVLNSNKNKLNSGHKLCQFCKDYHYDSAALYSHMQKYHYTCYMCPPHLMFRYYNTLNSLRDHYRSEHIVCEICDQNPTIAESGINVSFKDFREYSSHMSEFHHLSTTQLVSSFRVGVGMNSSSNNSSGRQIMGFNGANSSPFVDLDMGSANPNYTAAGGGGGNNNSNNNSSAQGGAPLIPANMQIAGRVTGTGRFAPLSAADIQMQAASNEYHAQQQNSGGNNRGALSAATGFEEHFPTLGGSATAAATTPTRLALKNKGRSTADIIDAKEEAYPALGAKKGAPPAPHPLSIINSRAQEAKLLEQKRKEKEERQAQEAEERRLRRNMALAEGLFGASDSRAGSGGGHMEGDSVSDFNTMYGLNNNNKLYIQNILQSFSSLATGGIPGQVLEAELLRTLYPAMLTTWARNNTNELLKIEKKIGALIADKSLNSIQLKPMNKAMRTSVHYIAKYYYLNSYEFDAEPNRYVSLVKTIHSYVPTMLISKAILLGSFVVPTVTTVAATTVGATTTATDATSGASAAAESTQQQQAALPVLFLQLNNSSLTANANYNSDPNVMRAYTTQGSGSKSLNNISLASAVFTTAQIVSKLVALVQHTQYYHYLANSKSSNSSNSNSIGSGVGLNNTSAAIELLNIVKVKASGANALGVEFANTIFANNFYITLLPYINNTAVVTSSAHEEYSQFLNYFSFYPGFTVLTPPPAADGHGDGSVTSGGSSNSLVLGSDGVSWVSVYSNSGANSNTFARSGTDKYIPPVPAVAYKGTLPAGKSTTSPQISSNKSSSASASVSVPDVSFLSEAELNDDWEEFLADHRKEKVTTTAEVAVDAAVAGAVSGASPSTAKYVAKRPAVSESGSIFGDNDVPSAATSAATSTTIATGGVARYVAKKSYATLPDTPVAAVASAVSYIDRSNTNVLYNTTLHGSIYNDENTFAESVAVGYNASAAQQKATKGTSSKEPAVKPVRNKFTALDDNEEDEDHSASAAYGYTGDDHDHNSLDKDGFTSVSRSGGKNSSKSGKRSGGKEKQLSYDSVVGTSTARHNAYSELMAQPGLTSEEVLYEIANSTGAALDVDVLLMNIIMKRGEKEDAKQRQMERFVTSSQSNHNSHSDTSEGFQKVTAATTVPADAEEQEQDGDSSREANPATVVEAVSMEDWEDACCVSAEENEEEFEVVEAVEAVPFDEEEN